METSDISFAVFFFLARRAKRGEKNRFREVVTDVRELSVFSNVPVNRVACMSWSWEADSIFGRVGIRARCSAQLLVSPPVMESLPTFSSQFKKRLCTVFFLSLVYCKFYLFITGSSNSGQLKLTDCV